MTSDILTHEGIVYWCIYVLLSHNELIPLSCLDIIFTIGPDLCFNIKTVIPGMGISIIKIGHECVSCSWQDEMRGYKNWTQQTIMVYLESETLRMKGSHTQMKNKRCHMKNIINFSIIPSSYGNGLFSQHEFSKQYWYQMRWVPLTHWTHFYMESNFA